MEQCIFDGTSDHSPSYPWIWGFSGGEQWTWVSLVILLGIRGHFVTSLRKILFRYHIHVDSSFLSSDNRHLLLRSFSHDDDHLARLFPVQVRDYACYFSASSKSVIVVLDPEVVPLEYERTTQEAIAVYVRRFFLLPKFMAYVMWKALSIIKH